MDAFPVVLPPLSALPSALQQSIAQVCANAVSVSHPYLLHTIGVPGSGKSALLAALQGAMPEAVPLSFDRMMIGLTEYRQLAALNGEQAFYKYEVPARQAGYYALRLLLEQRAPILFEHSAAAVEHPKLLRHAKGLGYRVVMAHLQVTPESAARRVQARGGRHTPPDYIPDRARLIAELLPAYEAVADIIIPIFNPDRLEAELAEIYQEYAGRVRAALLDSVG